MKPSSALVALCLTASLASAQMTMPTHRRPPRSARPRSRQLPPRHPHHQPRSPEVLRSGHGLPLRLQPRRSPPLLRQSRGARSQSCHAAMGNRPRRRPQLQRHRHRQRPRKVSLRRHQQGEATCNQRPCHRNRLHRTPSPTATAKTPNTTCTFRASATPKRWPLVSRSILTTSTPPPSTPKA